MSCDWAARLDARGYHTTSIKRPDTAGSWSGPTTVAEDGWKDGVSIIVHEAKEEATRALPQLELNVGDAARPLAFAGDSCGRQLLRRQHVPPTDAHSAVAPPSARPHREAASGWLRIT